MKKLLSQEQNYNFYELESLKDLETVYADSKKDIYYYKEYQFKIWRTKNDINGNPLYRLELNRNNRNITRELKGLVKRVNLQKGYGLIQSYSLEDDLSIIFKSLEKNKDLER